MASSSTPTLNGDGDNDGESDYGSDFSIGEESIVNKLLEDIGNNTSILSSLTTTAPNYRQFVSSIASPTDTIATSTSSWSTPSASLRLDNKHHASDLYALSENVPSAKVQEPGAGQKLPNYIPYVTPSLPLGSIQYPNLNRILSDPGPDIPPKPEPTQRPTDSRSPLQRFRSFPKKPLTVSDLSSGAWCELQYWYTLTLLPGGRKRRTAAMRGGTRVHQTLEDQVHTTVEVNITTKEEAFALRIWNIIQGLRTLRETGMTRELEVWGIIEGQVVNGIIDEVSHESPNAAFEQELSQSDLSKGFTTGVSSQQASIVDFSQRPLKKIYLTDVKTRGSDRLPTGAALRPARVQLFLYHRLLGEMASGVVDFTVILDRYGLIADALFSDAFMAQVGDLHDEIFYDADSDVEGTSSPRSTRSVCDSDRPDSSSNRLPQDLIKYRSISQILPLLRSELRETFPHGAATLGELLAVQYRHRDGGRILGNNSFPNDPEALENYIRENLKWWRGERDPEGVSIEETYKCRSCEFAERCQWRKDKEAEFLRKKRSVTSIRT
ncbi:exonuclease V [Daldinia caldariorum]|uniref:exonuclease V n=1 Tax=Daldinia caldariorum TaxID=326644 RepID=UPI0020086AAA|nr:exonuclease V [Daldinia caldariorum]KAI1463070.1 exonuclease V [Daldinia caldariorum]